MADKTLTLVGPYVSIVHKRYRSRYKNKPSLATPYAHIPFYWEQEGMFILVPMQVSLRLNAYIGCTT